MAGIYFHIPFCKSRCLYCDFFSSTDMLGKEAYIDAMCRELQERNAYLKDCLINTIYFGGGSPSLLSARDFEKIFRLLHLYYCDPDDSMEITLEANPDDVTAEYLESLQNLPFNRISLGVQSFNDNELKFLNRRHNARSAIRAIELCRKKGFENISIDLMYGLPDQTMESWEISIRQALAMDIRHLSAYHLMYEEGTPLFDEWKRGCIQAVSEEASVAMFDHLIHRVSAAGFEHYEISNFAQPAYHSIHNSAYWDGSPYLGIGASAHSYDGLSRQWNKAISGANYRMYGVEMEVLDEKAVFNDFIITRLRTMRGINIQELQSLFGLGKKEFCLKQSAKYLSNQLLEITDNYLRLTRKGIFVSDGIMVDLMI